MNVGLEKSRCWSDRDGELGYNHARSRSSASVASCRHATKYKVNSWKHATIILDFVLSEYRYKNWDVAKKITFHNAALGLV